MTNPAVTTNHHDLAQPTSPRGTIRAAGSIADLSISVGSMDFARTDLAHIARLADDLGVHTMLVTESTGRDAFALLAELAARTNHIGLGTGIVNIHSRTPTAIAAATATVMETMGDRPFTLGLGTSGRQLMQKYHGADFARPVSRLAEYVRIIDHTFRTGSLPDDSTMFPLAALPFGLELPPREQLSIYVAGLSDRTLKLTGRYADGWMPIWMSAAYGAELAQVVFDAAEAVGRPRPEVAAVSYGGVGESPELIRHVKATLAWYVAANGTAYRRLFERYGYGDEIEKICQLWTDGRREQAREAVSDQLLRDTTLLGSPQAFFAQVRRLADIGVSRAILRVPGQLSAAEVIDMLTRLAGDHGIGGDR
jgi:alkanesulfonate monooxygenase SsuD/methylene tetrahydromethanopterin reductase-like flavin-dependent oxidoreductase (luciferase family)